MSPDREPEPILESGPSDPLDDFWLEQGRKMVQGSLPAQRAAAKALMTAIGLMNTVYLGILGFAELIPATTATYLKVLYVLPILLWLCALALCLAVMLTERIELNLHAPAEIRDTDQAILNRKQEQLKCAFLILTVALLGAFALIAFNPGI